MDPFAEIDWTLWGPVIGVIVFVVVVSVVAIYCCCCRNEEDDRRSVSSNYPPPDNVFIHSLPAANDKRIVSSNNNNYPQAGGVSVNNNRYTPPDSVQQLSEEYIVGNKFMSKHVATSREMPSKNRRQFADKKAKGNYTRGLPDKYSIIVVEDEDRFRKMMVAEARQNAYGQSPFTTNATFKVVNFRLIDDHFNYDEEGQARLVLRCNEYNEICHIDSVEFLY